MAAVGSKDLQSQQSAATLYGNSFIQPFRGMAGHPNECAMDRKIARWPRPFLEEPFVTQTAEDPFNQEDAETRAMIHHYLYLAEKLLPHHPSGDQAEEENAA